MEDARKLFESGDLHRQITRRSFDFVYAVFDRDDHLSYHAALALAESLDGRLRNDQKQKVRFVAMLSVPCFEQWLLLHYEDIQAPLHRDEVQNAYAATCPTTTRAVAATSSASAPTSPKPSPEPKT